MSLCRAMGHSPALFMHMFCALRNQAFLQGPLNPRGMPHIQLNCAIIWIWRLTTLTNEIFAPRQTNADYYVRKTAVFWVKETQGLLWKWKPLYQGALRGSTPKHCIYFKRDLSGKVSAISQLLKWAFSSSHKASFSSTFRYIKAKLIQLSYRHLSE